MTEEDQEEVEEDSVIEEEEEEEEDLVIEEAEEEVTTNIDQDQELLFNKMKVSLVIQYIFFKYKLIRSVFIHFLWKITFFTVQLHIK